MNKIAKTIIIFSSGNLAAYLFFFGIYAYLIHSAVQSNADESFKLYATGVNAGILTIIADLNAGIIAIIVALKIFVGAMRKNSSENNRPGEGRVIGRGGK